MTKSLIVYYSLGGKTKKVVDILEKLTNADVYEIEMEKPYTKLTAYTIGLGHCRIGYEPPIKDSIDLSSYNKIFIYFVFCLYNRDYKNVIKPYVYKIISHKIKYY